MRESRGSFSYKDYNNRLLVYDIENDTWEKTEIKLEKRAYHQINQFKNSIYVLGGKKLAANGRTEYLNDKIEILQLDSLHIKVDDINPHQAVNFASFVHEDKLIVMGGSVSAKKDGAKKYTDKIRFLNLNTGYWYDLGVMNRAKEVSGVLIKNKIYLIGGYANEVLSDIESFDLMTGKWEKEGELFFGLERPGLTSSGNIIYIYNHGKILKFDVVDKSLKSYDLNLNISRANLHYSENKLYIIGGYREDRYKKEPSKDLYSVDVKEFSNTKPSETFKM